MDPESSPNGGAVALGHPIFATGRSYVKAMYELATHRRTLGLH